MVFNGTGIVMAKEEGGYHPAVSVQFQKKAYVDLPTIMEDVDKRLGPWFAANYPPDEKHIHFLDNLSCQKNKAYVEKCKATLNAQNAYGPPHMTYVWAPLDRGHLISVLKELGKQRFNEWMEKPSIVEPAATNWERWEANKITASEKRILMTWVFGESYQELCGPKYKKMRATAFQRGGCALTLTGVNDHTVIPEGFASPLELELPGVPFKDQAYLACAWSASDRFGVPLAPVTPTAVAEDDMDEKGEDSVTDEEMPDIFGNEDSDTDTDKEAEIPPSYD